MSKFYTEKRRALQEKFDTRRIADLLENAVVHGAFEAHEAEFIQSLDMFFLSTVDASGRRHQPFVAAVSQL
jgi:predicted pyridoxine 5'-phosphate oxidase superfamily flavin-nucleotide-binding protein